MPITLSESHVGTLTPPCIRRRYQLNSNKAITLAQIKFREKPDEHEL